jgi:hypothetical protein
MDDRPELTKALRACRVYGAKLVIAKLHRLSRDAHFLLGLEKADVDFVAADMPHATADGGHHGEGCGSRAANDLATDQGCAFRRTEAWCKAWGRPRCSAIQRRSKGWP